jgi:hypothetical protein
MLGILAADASDSGGVDCCGALAVLEEDVGDQLGNGLAVRVVVEVRPARELAEAEDLGLERAPR